MIKHPQQEYIPKEYIIDEIQIRRIIADPDAITFALDNVVHEVLQRPITPAPAAPNCDNCAELMSKAREHGFEAGRNQTLDEQRKNVVFEIIIDQLKRDDYVREVAYQISKYVGTKTKITFESLRIPSTQEHEQK